MKDQEMTAMTGEDQNSYRILIVRTNAHIRIFAKLFINIYKTLMSHTNH